MKRKSNFSEIEELKMRLQEAEETLQAIEHGEIDALVVKGQEGNQIYTLKGADYSYRVLIESMNEGALTLSKDATIFYSNRFFANLVKMPLEKIIGTSIYSFISPDDRKTFEKILKGQNKGEINIKVGDKTLPTYVSLAPLELDHERGFSMIVTDLADRKELEKEKETLKHERIVARQRDEFIGLASHELRTPVTSIKAFTQVLQKRFRTKGDEKSVEFFSTMDKQLDKLTFLISDLLDVSKIQTGKIQFREEEFDYNILVEEIIEEMRITTDKHKLIKALDKTKIIYADRNRIGQVLTNFLSNAIKYSKQGSEIIIKTSVNKNEIITSIQDFGIGIPKKNLEHVFDRFFRVGGIAEGTYPGMGLGLYISSEIIKRHKGKIWAKSTKGKGSTFYFSLPLEEK